jgi:uncharacterized protein YndB with AHSA1/START domain
MQKGNNLIFTKEFNSPRELVWDAWTNPDYISDWWGPKGFTTTIQQMDVVPGGVWRFIMHGPDGRNYKSKIQFIEVVKPERLVYKHVEEEGTGPVHFRVEVLFTQLGKKTSVSMKMTFDSPENLDQLNRDRGIENGARDTLERLMACLNVFETE